MSTAYSQLAPPLQRILWEMRWESLRPLQERAIPLILNTDRDLLISARTAAGKTEAAFLPILSQICEAPGASVRALYVGPLKALINDQFRRLEELCQHAEIPVHRWHGDVGAILKRKLLNRPSGVLLITPESIESLFVNQSHGLASLFSNLAFIVIDELHALLGSERGTHLRSLLHRLESFVVTPFRLVALSATLGDLPLTARWMRPDAPENVEILRDEDQSKAIRFGIFGYRRVGFNSKTASSSPDEETEVPPEGMTRNLYDAFSREKGLIFANSKADVEFFGDQLNQISSRDGLSGRFLVHHGALSRQIREETETLMQENLPRTTVCSSTLELGIDIGNVALVGQIGCPWSVSSLIQRLGRSGRQDGQPHIMRLYILEETPDARSPLCDRLYPDLLQAIALTELMQEKWVEPPSLVELDFSTFTQQILSVIAETGGLPARELFRRLVTNGAFRWATVDVFRTLLQSLGAHDLIEQTASADLILGLAGEEIVRHYDFYSAFATAPEFRVSHDGVVLGSIPVYSLPRVGDHLLFAGRRWQVLAIDDHRKELSVRPARGRKRPFFQGSPSEVHPRVRELMRKVLLSAEPVPYLNAEASTMLRDARQTARELGLDRTPFVEESQTSTLWFTWTGSRAHRTLLLALQAGGISCTDSSGIAIAADVSGTEIQSNLSRLSRIPLNPDCLARQFEPRISRKYDQYVDERLLLQSISDERLDCKTAAILLSEGTK